MACIWRERNGYGPTTVSDVLDARGLTIFLPAWNEVEGITRAVAAATESGEALIAAGEIGEFEVLVVDDASTDGTGELLDGLAASDARVRVVHHAVNRRLGGAMKTGFTNARGAFVLYTDADLPFDLAEHDRTGEGPRRVVYSYAYNSLIHWLIGLRLRDVNFAAKLIRRDVLDAIELRSEGSFIDVELLAKAQRMGFRIIQFGVDYFPRTRGVSTLSSPTVIAKIIRELVALLPEIRAAGARVRPN